MEQNENIENNGFENFEDQRKYKSISNETKKKADQCAILAEKAFLLALFIFLFGVMFPFIFVEEEWKYMLISIPTVATGMSYIVSIVYTVNGWKIAREKKIKDMVVLHIIVPSATIVGIGIGLGVIYVFWSAFSGFAPEKVTFWEWIL